MAKPLDFHRASLMAFKQTLDRKSPKEKENSISTQLADQFNRIVANIKKEHPEAEPHLPEAITSKGLAAMHFQLADISHLDFELLVNQVLATLEVIRGDM